MGNTVRKRTVKRSDSIVDTVKDAQKKYLESVEGLTCDDSDSDLEEDEEDSDDCDSGNRINFKKSRTVSVLDVIDRKAKNIDPCQYDFPFENLIFEGGGNKGLAYCGAVRVLEEMGLWAQIKRLAGASAGAMTAALLAVGYNSRDIESFLSQDLSKVFLDHQCGYCSLLPNLLSGYGWNPGNKIFRWFGNVLETRTKDKDITFKQIYEKYGKELCVVVTNLNQMDTEYCHPKTTPDMPIRVAVRMSMSIPGMFRAPKFRLHHVEDTFVDGGVLCNYPIHCYDGWWLSLDHKDSFIRRLQPLSALSKLYDRKQRFGEFNPKTIGFLLYADNESDIMKFQLERRLGAELQDPPDTKLAREKIKTRELQTKADREHRRIVRAVDSFLKVLQRHNLDKNSTISIPELRNALQDVTTFTMKRRRRIFGDVDDEMILKYLDRDGNGQITYCELMRFMEDTGIMLQSRFVGYGRKDVTSLLTFFSTLQSALLTNVTRAHVGDRDLQRTVGINTGHVGTTDFVLEEADRQFVVEQGRRSVTTFLKYYAALHNPPKKGFHPLNTSTEASSLGNGPESGGMVLIDELDPTNSVKIHDVSLEATQPLLGGASKG